MAATQFVPLTGQLVDEGVFLQDLNMELADLQDRIVKYVEQFGDNALKAVAKLDIQVALKVENTDDKAFSVKTTIKTTMPKRPASVSMAMGGVDDGGKMALFVRSSGSDEVHPRQMKLATRDGRVIDPETGRVLD
ncbi:MAG: hypothetical protein IT422_04935 [Pirellulaceae bacterium]|nr:hypothetical protein [Pirellulaceae bacterium]